ncbi:MAG: hypothetical protein ACI4QB_09430 [Eubacteriales bacterium]
MEENEKKPPQEEEVPESASARILRGLGQDNAPPPPDHEPEHVGFWENFWYHHKWKTIIIAAAVLVLTVTMIQTCSRETPDVYLMYAGPAYLTPNEARAVQDAVRQVMEDYNGDGERGVMLTDVNYLTPEQIDEKMALAEAQGVELIFDYAGNASQRERFEVEVIAGESVICILDPALYEDVKKAGGLLPLTEVLGETPPEAIDEYGIRFGETKFARYFTAMQVLPEDSVLCIRRLSTMSAFKGKAKSERIHAYHTALFTSMVRFEFPEGYTETTAAQDG